MVATIPEEVYTMKDSYIIIKHNPGFRDEKTQSPRDPCPCVRFTKSFPLSLLEITKIIPSPLVGEGQGEG